MKDENFLKNYINSFSPSGFENEAQQMWIDYMFPMSDKIKVDNYGNAVGTIIQKKTLIPEMYLMKTNSILVEAHVDEVAYRVNMITDKGLVYVIKNGSSDHQIAPSSRVKIHTEKGLVDGVFGWPAIHTRETGTKEVQPSTENLFIDCGVDSKDELEKLGVKIGCLVTYPYNFEKIGNYYTGKSLDNKIGGYILSQVCKKIKEDNLEHLSNILFANVVQEEVGLRGANMICEKYEPNVAIVLDVTHDTSTPLMNKKKSGDVTSGKGPVILFSPMTQQTLVNIIEKIAIEKGIPYQRKSLGRSTGTDCDAYSIRGIVSALISIPLKYMHTKVEMVHEKDVDFTIDLVYEVLKTIDNVKDYIYLKGK
jgi:putative aminopeptidase FrvX